jgi:hypothetical protein
MTVKSENERNAEKPEKDLEATPNFKLDELYEELCSSPKQVVKDVNVDGTVELRRTEGGKGRLNFPDGRAKTGVESSLSSPNQFEKDVNVGGTVALRKAKANWDGLIGQF